MTRLLSALVLVLAAVPAFATNVVVSHAGYLLDAADQPLTRNAVPMTFEILPGASGGTAIWTGTCTADVKWGDYAVVLGGGCGPALDASVFSISAERWLEVTVDGVLLAPRLRLGASPASALAANALAIEGQTLANLDARFTGASAPIAWARLTDLPAGLDDGDQVGLTEVATGGGLAGTGVVGDEARLAAGGVTSAHLASDEASLAKVSGGALSANGGVLTASTFKVGNVTTCDQDHAGVIRFDGAHFAGCDGTDWVTLSGSGSGGSSSIPAPVGVTATYIGTATGATGSYRLSWSAPGGTIDGYVVERYTSTTGTFAVSPTATQYVSSNTLSVDFAGIPNDASHFFRVAAKLGADTGAFGASGLSVFTSPTTHTWARPDGVTQVEVLLVGGGGGGGIADGAGGGAGGLFQGTAAVTASSYTVIVGAGGGQASSGGSTSFGPYTVAGGGGGGSSAQAAGSGGSGGGGSSGGAAGNAIPGQGRRGGSGYPGSAGAGGGGAGGPGVNAPQSTGSAGGPGLASTITGSSLNFAGGGGGKGDSSAAAGGLGGGGSAGSSTGAAGTANTGGGGGGGGSTGGAGGSGIVIVRCSPNAVTVPESGSILAPTALNVAYVGSPGGPFGNYQITWTGSASSGVTGYLVEDYAASGGVYPASPTNVFPRSSATNATILALNDTAHVFRVRTLTATGMSAPSAGVGLAVYTTVGGNSWTRPASTTSVQYLVVAGGGGGGTGDGAGGGAGGMLTGTLAVSAATYGTNVGAGGGSASQGGSSTFASVTATGGGAGGSGGGAGGAGGSGGGGSGGGGGGTGIGGQGNNGGNGYAGSAGGGGGGAGAVGVSAPQSNGAAGGAGLASTITGTSLVFAGGGGGKGDLSAAAGGNGGGGNGTPATGTGGPGTPNTGGGGGGSGAAGGAGGSGIVVLRYSVP